MGSKTIEDFIKFAKRQFDCDVLLKASEEPDTFESIFGASFLGQNDYIEKVDGFEHDLRYENNLTNVQLVIESDLENLWDGSMYLAA